MSSRNQQPALANTEFVDGLCRHGYITDQRVKAAFLKVDRGDYAPRHAYQHSQDPIGFWAVVNLPYLDTLAIEACLEYLVPTSECSTRRVLDVGSGSGYTTHLLAEMVGSSGLVVGIDHFHQLRDIGERNMRKSARGRELLHAGRVAFVTGDGRDGLTSEQRRGLAQVNENTRWDVIHVGASAKFTVPTELMRQLKAPGCMFIPIQQVKFSRLAHVVWKLEKDAAGEVTRTIIREDSDSDWLQHLPDDTEEERNQPGYGVIPNAAEVRSSRQSG